VSGRPASRRPGWCGVAGPVYEAAVRTELTIDAVAPGGEGVGRDGARAVFVPFTAPGDLVEADVPPGEGVAHAELVRVLAPGPDRVEPPCRHFGPPSGVHAGGPDLLCGGCEWLHLRYEAQLAAKARGFAETLRRIAKLEPGAYELRSIVPSPEALRYRSRAKFHWDRSAARLVYFRRRSHEPLRVEECWLLAPALDALREAMNPALAAARLDVREVALEWADGPGPHAGRGAAWLKLAAISPAAKGRAEALLAAVPALSGIVLTAEGAPAVVVGDPVLRHARRPDDPAAGRQRSRPDVFQQANRAANAQLVAAAVAPLAGSGEVLELYCGAGNFTAALAAGARAVYAVEVQGPSLELARADLSGGNIRFHAGDALAVARGLAREGRRFDAALLDPPREGAKGIGPVLRDLGVARAAYVSCDPATLARDVRGCVEAGYRVAWAQPFDLFPQTHHVEGLVVLERS